MAFSLNRNRRDNAIADGIRGENDTIYTWRKLYGPGKVSFTSNASGQSIHRVYDAPVFGPMLNPVAVLEEAIDQQTLDSLLIYVNQQRVIDEIRIGPSSTA